ncbi:MAG: RNA methyltransferase [Marinilabiliaceae bacterium]|nr:RNA methyltransferase [Marinilabiliaceae bacterium]
MLSKNKIKLINSLRLKKNRDKLELFCLEGHKIVIDIYNSGAQIETIIATPEWLISNNIKANEIITASTSELKLISQLSTIPSVIALIKHPKFILDETKIKNELILILDEIQDPGNLGTIIRMANWFGINSIICSPTSVDCFNFKVVQASMGAIMSVNVFYTDLKAFINKHKSQQFKTFGTFLNGANIYKETLPQTGMIVLGNEGNGISNKIERLIDKKLFIPSFSSSVHKPESLNVSIAASIVCSEFKRRNI